MRLKTLGRISGVVTATGCSYMEYLLCYRVLSNIDYNKLGDFLYGDYPLEYKIGVGAYLSLISSITSILALYLTDGLVDVVKGTHHYFLLSGWKKLTRNQERRKRLGRILEEMLEIND